jgi:hypothetical protein
MGRVTVQWRGPAWLRRPAEAVGWEEIYTRATKVSLWGPKYDDRCIEHLVKLRRLESITLSNTGFSEQGIRRLQRALPNCRIEGKPPAGGSAWTSAFACAVALPESP